MATKKAPAKTQATPVAASANNNILFAVIIVLLIIIAILAFFVGRNMGGSSAPVAATPITNNGEDVTVTIIDDKRCTNCGTAEIAGSIKQVPFLALATFVEQDFSDDGVEAYLQENEITTLPAVIFDTNALGDGGTMAPYMKPLPNGDYSLEIGAVFDPFIERSEKGFMIIDQEVLSEVRGALHTVGSSDPQLLWIEYSDLGCGACKQFHEQGIIESVMEKHSDIVARATVGFLSVGGQVSENAMEAIECMAEQQSSLHNDAWTHFYKTGSYSSSELETFAKENGVDIADYTSCISENKKAALVQAQKNQASQYFGVTGTPGNIVINLETGEYISAGWDIESAIGSLR